MSQEAAPATLRSGEDLGGLLHWGDAKDSQNPRIVVNRRADLAMPLGFGAKYRRDLLWMWRVTYGDVEELAASFGMGSGDEHRAAVVGVYQARGRWDAGSTVEQILELGVSTLPGGAS